MNRRGFLQRLLAAAAAAAVPLPAGAAGPLIVPVRFVTRWVDGELVIEVENPGAATVPFIVTASGGAWSWHGANGNDYEPLSVSLEAP